MAYTVAVITSTEHEKPDGLCPAFGADGSEVVCVYVDEFLPVALELARPDFAVIASAHLRNEAASLQNLLDSLGIAYLGSTATCIRNLDHLGQLFATILQAARTSQIEAFPPAHCILDTESLEALQQCGKLAVIAQNERLNYPLLVKAACAHDDTYREATNAQELESALKSLPGDGRDVIVMEKISGVDCIVPVVGDISDILVLPAIEIEHKNPEPSEEIHIPLRLSSLSDNETRAQDIRSQIERAALDAFLVCGCRDLACVRIIWDGGAPRILDVIAEVDMSEDGYLVRDLKACDIALSDVARELADIVYARHEAHSGK